MSLRPEGSGGAWVRRGAARTCPLVKRHPTQIPSTALQGWLSFHIVNRVVSGRGKISRPPIPQSIIIKSKSNQVTNPWCVPNSALSTLPTWPFPARGDCEGGAIATERAGLFKATQPGRSRAGSAADSRCLQGSHSYQYFPTSKR